MQCPATTRALLRGLTPSSQPLILILDQVPARLKVVTAYFDDAGCAVIAADDVEQALTISSVVSPDLMVLPEQRPGIGGAGLDRLRSQHPTCPVAVTTVLDGEAVPINGRGPHTSGGAAHDERADRSDDRWAVAGGPRDLQGSKAGNAAR